MSGLRRLCRMYGALETQGVMWVWDYAKEEPVKKGEQTKEEWAASERRKYELITKGLAAPSELEAGNEVVEQPAPPPPHQ